jgi:beta-catenin-like protein 1
MNGGSSPKAASLAPFIPSSEWRGSKEFYSFKAGSQGTGYYLDPHQLPHNNNNNNNTQQQQEDADSSSRPALKRARFDTDQNQTKIIPNLLEQAEEERDSKNNPSKAMDLSPKGLRAATSILIKGVARNELERAKHADDPTLYMASEVALYEHIVALKGVAAAASELYPVIHDGDEDLLATLSQLLLHTNTDIVTSVISVLLEWMDPSLLEEEAAFEPTVALAYRVLVDTSDTLVASLERLMNESEHDQDVSNTTDGDDDVGKGAEDVLSLFENLLEMEPIVAAIAGGDKSSDTPSPRLAPKGHTVASYLCQHTTLFIWLLQQIENVGSNSNTILTALQGRAMELLASLAPREEIYVNKLSDWSKIPLTVSNLIEENGDIPKSTKTHIDGIEIILQVVAAYKKKQPNDDLHVEFLENACIVMAAALTYSLQNMHAFLDYQGVELVVRCLKERVHAGGVALKWLDFGTGNDKVHRLACQQLVDAGALKFLFPMFMGRSLPKQALAPTKKQKKEWNVSMETTLIRIMYTLTHQLRDDSPHDALARLLAKFNDDEKCDRLVELCMAYAEKARAAEYNFYKSDIEDELGDEEEAIQFAALSAKLEGGGDMYHRLGAILAFCCVGSRRCHERILSQLMLQQSGIGLIVDALEEFISVLDEGEQKMQLQQLLKQIL